MYYIEGFPIGFNSLSELFSYVAGTGKFLYQYQFLTVYFGSFPCCWIIIEWNPDTNQHFVTYQDYPRK